MWAGRSRIPSLFFSHPPLLRTPPSSRLLSVLSRSAASSKDFQQLSTDCSGFLPWLQQKAGNEISSSLSIGNSIYGRSLFASKSIEEGECLLKVPYSVHLTPDKVLPEIESLIGTDVSNIGRLAVVLLAEKKINQDSAWTPYVNSLPLLEDMDNTIFWSEDELEMVRQSPIFQETLDQKACIRKELSMVKPALEHFPQFFGDYALQDFKHAYAIEAIVFSSSQGRKFSVLAFVCKKGWIACMGNHKGLVFDFLNHDGISEAVLLSDEDKEISEVIADRDYAAGEQVLIRYGKFPNATLLLDFGFTLAYNVHDQAQISMDVPRHDPLCTEKLELLQRHSMPTTIKGNDFHSAGFSFTIKEVGSSQGRGKGIPQSLRAYARVLSATSTEELQDMTLEAAENDGRLARRPLKNRISEMKAHYILLSHFTRIQQEYDASIESLGPAISPDENSRQSRRRNMARDLLTGELRVLKSAVSWLTSYCKSLSVAVS